MVSPGLRAVSAFGCRSGGREGQSGLTHRLVQVQPPSSNEGAGHLHTAGLRQTPEQCLGLGGGLEAQWMWAWGLSWGLKESSTQNTDGAASLAFG